MYPIERYMKVLKSYVKNYKRSEGSIVENYIADESVEFCFEYLAKPDAIGLPKSTNFESKALSIGNFYDIFLCLCDIFLCLINYECIFLFMWVFIHRNLF